MSGHFLYRHFDEKGSLLYVGITLNPRARLRNHSSKEWYSDVRRITLVPYQTRREVIDAETNAIRTESPLFNIKKTDLKSGTGKPKQYKDILGTRLSQYERDILRLIVYGMDDGEIAKAIGISASTAQSRRRDIMRKTGQHSSPKLIMFGRKLFGIKEPEIEPQSFVPMSAIAPHIHAEPLDLQLG